jgi:hypothetical protein
MQKKSERIKNEIKRDLRKEKRCPEFIGGEEIGKMVSPKREVQSQGDALHNPHARSQLFS